MADGAYWNGSKWVSKDEMTRTRHTLNPNHRPAPKPAKAQPKETTNARRPEPSRRD